MKSIMVLKRSKNENPMSSPRDPSRFPTDHCHLVPNNCHTVHKTEICKWPPNRRCAYSPQNGELQMAPRRCANSPQNGDMQMVPKPEMCILSTKRRVANGPLGDMQIIPNPEICIWSTFRRVANCPHLRYWKQFQKVQLTEKTYISFKCLESTAVFLVNSDFITSTQSKNLLNDSIKW